MSYIDRYKTAIALHHLDFMGHVNNATYLQLMEEARWHFYNHFGYTRDIVTKEQKGPIILETHIKYRKEILLDEIVTIETICLEYSGVLGRMLQTIYKENGKKSCQAELVFGMLDLQKRKLLRPKGFWQDIHIKMFEYTSSTEIKKYRSRLNVLPTELQDLQEFINNNFKEDPYFGRMTDPTTSARIKGPCGDDMEFYLTIKNNIITDIKYFTETGCCNTKIAGNGLARRVKDKNIYDALEINPGIIIKEEKGLTPSGQHCAILATTTFYRAIALYLLEIED